MPEQSTEEQLTELVRLIEMKRDLFKDKEISAAKSFDYATAVKYQAQVSALEDILIHCYTKGLS